MTTLTPLRPILHSGITALLLLLARPSGAQELQPDPATLLLLHCNQSMSGAGGESPTQLSGITYDPSGIFGYAASLAPGNQVRYASAGNIQSSQGTVEFWFRPSWNGNDGQGHWIVAWGGAGGLL